MQAFSYISLASYWHSGWPTKYFVAESDKPWQDSDL